MVEIVSVPSRAGISGSKSSSWAWTGRSGMATLVLDSGAGDSSLARWFDCGRGWVAAWLACGVLLATTAAAAQPSIVVILSDDEDVASHRVMSADQGPDRGPGHGARQLLRHLFILLPVAHHHPARPVPAQPPDRGQRVARRRLREVHGRWGWAARRSRHGCSRPGYRTAFLGKLMNGYEPETAHAAARVGRVVRRRRASSPTSTTRSTRTARWSPTATSPRTT